MFRNSTYVGKTICSLAQSASLRDMFMSEFFHPQMFMSTFISADIFAQPSFSNIAFDWPPFHNFRLGELFAADILMSGFHPHVKLFMYGYALVDMFTPASPLRPDEYLTLYKGQTFHLSEFNNYIGSPWESQMNSTL